MKLLPWLATVFFIVGVTSGTTLADYQTGLQAYAKKDYARAIKEFKADGSGRSCFNLGVIYYKGEGVKANHEEGIKWFKKAADMGDAQSQFLLGTIYDKGEDVPKDMSVAAGWYRKAAEQGHVIAQYNLGLMYTNGEGVEKDRKEAVVWLKKAAKQGHVNAKKLLKVMGEEVPGTPLPKTKKPAGHPG